MMISRGDEYSPPCRRPALATAGSLLLVLCLACCLAQDANLAAADSTSTTTTAEVDDVLETITYTDPASGLEHEEYAFREPARGLPHHVLDMFCSSVRVRLYWNVFRDEIKSTARKGLYLKRMARLAKHIFAEVRDIDKPFNATQLSVVDEYMGVGGPASSDGLAETEEDQKLDKAVSEGGGAAHAEATGGGSSGGLLGGHGTSFKALKGLKQKLTKKLGAASPAPSRSQAQAQESTHVDEQQLQQQNTEDAAEQLDSSDLLQELERQGQGEASSRLRSFLKKLTFKKVALGVYTRWRTMWWMMMSCLFAKYYLWDPALDEFLKLKRTLLMWPELQLVQMHELQCKPLVFFRRTMDICKILNPLMKIDFGQFNLEKLTRFKGD